MSSDSAGLWLTFVAIGLATTLPRASFIVLGSRVQLPAIVERALRYAPASALAAVVGPDLLVRDGALHLLDPKLAAGAVAVLVALRWRNPWLPFLAGMGTLWGLRALLGG